VAAGVRESNAVPKHRFAGNDGVFVSVELQMGFPDSTARVLLEAAQRCAGTEFVRTLKAAIATPVLKGSE